VLEPKLKVMLRIKGNAGSEGDAGAEGGASDVIG